MPNLKLLNKKYLTAILFYLFFGLAVNSQEPVDIWSIEEKKTSENFDINQKNKEENTKQNSIYKMQSQKNDEPNIEEDQELISKEIKIVGLYDPAENGLDINMWSKSNGDQILKILKRINKMSLSKDASEILNILLLTNAHYPTINISKDQFLELKSNWLTKNSNFQLIESYLIKNQIANEQPKLAKLLVDDYLSRSEINKACKVFSNIKNSIQDDYLSKFNIYCLINDNKKEEAQLMLDLKKEQGFKNKFYENKINFLMGFTNTPDLEISDDTILDFHLSHRTNPEFKFEPNNSTSKKIWKYLSTSNLLGSIKDIELTDLDKINRIEKATHEKHYSEKELFELYKRFQFNINQLLNIKESTKVLSSIESRALIYQGILITNEIENKLLLINALKNSFKNEGLEKAFDVELKKFLKKIDKDEIPSEYTSFYNYYIDEDETKLTNIKINNKILHQSKMINYFKEDGSSKDITKDLNNLLKKIKKNKKYFFSKKDIILVEAFKSDGIKVSEKFKNLYEISDAEMPSDIQILIDNGDMGNAMLRIVEVIGQDDLKNIDVDTLYFIISTLNQLNTDQLRNRILLKVLPLKV
ncbi:hypothetical protein VP91_00003120 [Candidatus Pelagibacter ubique]|uniref:Uncharacterized protein n=1 Tax=Pelagibacter ubique TaxID=198252 RepID=A0ABX1T2A7_PELUQ|nr:hypothetical protein [Candidatus Pelagibacter ubique]NMN67173.1 hypothetical protein [Candidatus Pelagibacter ubique]